MLQMETPLKPPSNQPVRMLPADNGVVATCPALQDVSLGHVEGATAPAGLLRAKFSLGHNAALEWGYPALRCTPLALAQQTLRCLDAAGLKATRVCFAGSALATSPHDAIDLSSPHESPGRDSICSDNSEEEQYGGQQLDIVFVLPNTTRDQIFQTRDLTLDALLAIMKDDLTKRSRHMVAAAYIQTLFITAQPATTADDVWAAYTMHCNATDSARLCLKFVQRCSTPEAVQLVCTPDVLRAMSITDSALARGPSLQCVLASALTTDSDLPPRDTTPPATPVTPSSYTGKLWEFVEASKARAASCVTTICHCGTDNAGVRA